MQAIRGGRERSIGGSGAWMGIRLALTAALVAAFLLMLLLAADAHGGTYEVHQCQHQAPQNHSHEALTSIFPSPGPYTVAAGSSVCSSATREYAIQAEPIGVALNGQYGLARFVAPRRHQGRRRRDQRPPAQRVRPPRPAGDGERRRDREGAIRGRRLRADGFSHYSWPAQAPQSAGAYQQFTAGLFCDNPGSLCPIAGGGSPRQSRHPRREADDQGRRPTNREPERRAGRWRVGAGGIVRLGLDATTRAAVANSVW